MLIIQTQWFFRNEKEKVAAVENYYNNEGVADGKMVIFLIFITKYGIPFLFTVFVSVYWTFGLMKYISGWVTGGICAVTFITSRIAFGPAS